MNFNRSQSPKHTLGIGMNKTIPVLMKNSKHDPENYEDILDWSIENDNINVFKYIINLDGKKWFDKQIKMHDQFHYLLWECSSNCMNKFIEYLLNLGQGFRDVELRLDVGHLRVPNTEARSGFYIHHTIADYIKQANQLGNKELVDIITDHYNKYK